MTKNSRLRIYLSSLLLLTFVLRLVIPFGNYILLPVLIIAILYVIYTLNKRDFQIAVNINFRNAYPIILLLIILVFHYILTPNKQEILTIEILHCISGFVIFGLLTLLIKSKSETIHLVNIFNRQIVYSSIIICILGFIKLYFQLRGYKFDILNIVGLGYPKGTSLVIDDNYFTLFLVFSIIIILSNFQFKLKKSKRLYYQTILIVLVIAIFLSTSRRGLIIVSIIMIMIYGNWIISMFKKNQFIVNIRNNTIFFGTTLFLILTLTYTFGYLTPRINRNEWLAYSGFNQLEVQGYINTFTFSSKSILKGETTFTEINQIWNANFDSRFPFSGWAKGDYEPINKLYGTNSEIVPDGAIGAKIDNGSGYSSWNGNLYYHSKIFERNVENGKRYIASIYCYVSPDYNGDWVRISSHGDIQGMNASYYDLNKKGEWQYLWTSFEGDTGSFFTRFYATKLMCTRPEKLTGSITYAFPEIQEVKFDQKNPVTWAGRKFKFVDTIAGVNSEIVPQNTIGYLLDKESNFSCSKSTKNYYSSTIIEEISVGESKEIKSTVYCYVSKDFNGSKVRLGVQGANIKGARSVYYDLSKKGEWQKLELQNYCTNGFIEPVLYFEIPNKNKIDLLDGYVIFAHPCMISISTTIKDSITKSKVSKIYDTFINKESADSESHMIPLKLNKERMISSILSIDMHSLYGSTDIDTLAFDDLFVKKMENDDFSGPRIDRWRYTFFLYKNDYNLYQKFLGGGFGYTRKFAKTFNDFDEFEYPHNPFLSVLLYSGMIGLLLYIWALFKVLKLYWIYRKKYCTLFLSFIAIFFYSFFSSNTPFSPAVMSLFMIIPYFIHFVHKREKRNEKMIESNQSELSNG